MTRETRTGREVKAGCFTCHGNMSGWTSKNAQGVAARHHDATGHPTLVEVSLCIYYGRETLEKSNG